MIRDRLPRALDPAPSVPSLPDSRPAAVLVPVLAAGEEPRLVFTERTQHLSRHAGEISFPGGLVDPGEDLAAAALREAREELGLVSDDVELLGSLPPVHTRVTGVLIVPFVGVLAMDPRFTPNAAEIAEVLEYPLSALIDRQQEESLEHEGRMFVTDVFDMDGHVIWGATARILREFLDALARVSRPGEE
ncbi:MAG TPA: CoA pyrophosphatase [Actinomycetota bacterium]|nr:CoA pyrophosphatase [Actinomycetota bacterium]